MSRPFVSLLSDFGLRDPSAAIMRGVVLGIAPDAEVLDISHDVRKYRVRDGALLLWCALPYLPVGAHVAVVDPGVGTERRPIAVRVDRGDTLVGPDNGLLLMAADRLGGPTSAVELASERHRLPSVSSSFHGRDIFAPAAAHLAVGTPIDDLGPAIDLETLHRLPVPAPGVRDGALDTHAIYVDTFGNVKLTALAEDLRQAFGELPSGAPLALSLGDDGRTVRLRWRRTFGDARLGEPLLYVDSYGRLCVAVNQGDASAALGLEEDLPISIRTASEP